MDNIVQERWNFEINGEIKERSAQKYNPPEVAKSFFQIPE